MKLIRIGIYAAIISLIALSSCKEDDINQPNTNNPNSFTVNMTDAPGDYAALNVEIERVEAYLENSGWVELSSESQIVNVLELTNGNQTTLAQQTGLEAGTYTAIAVYFGDENSLVVNAGGAETNFDLSGEGAVIIEINQDIEAESEAEVLLDFNVAESVIESAGEIVIEPSVEEVEDTETGVQGELSVDAQALVMLSNGSDTISAYTDANGAFFIQGVAEGTYDLTVQLDGESDSEFELPGLPDLFGDDEGQNDDDIIEATFENVTIIEGEITQMGTLEIG